MGILRRTERSTVRGLCVEQLNGRKISTGLMFMMGLSETIDQLAMTNSLRWYGHVLRREDGHVLRRAFAFEDEGQGKNRRLLRTWKKQAEELSGIIGL